MAKKMRRRRTSRRGSRQSPSRLRENPGADLDVQPGDVLLVERHPVYDHPGSPPSLKTSRKKVKDVKVLDDGRVLLKLHGMTYEYSGRKKIHRAFVLSGNDQNGYWLRSSEPTPLRYQVVEVEGRGDLIPNRRARAIGNKPSMDTGFFGKDLDDDAIDSVTGAKGKHLDAALRRYKTFHAKDPIRVAELAHDVPKKWVAVGDALAVMYRTDKWKKYGVDEDYKHLHDKSDGVPYEMSKGVRLYEPATQAGASKVHGRQPESLEHSGPQSLPVGVPQAVTLLGYCLGFFVRRDDDGEIYEVNPRGSYLYSSPSGDLLLVYSPHDQANGANGFLAAFAGGRLRVLKDGIDG